MEWITKNGALVLIQFVFGGWAVKIPDEPPIFIDNYQDVEPTLLRHGCCKAVNAWKYK